MCKFSGMEFNHEQRLKPWCKEETIHHSGMRKKYYFNEVTWIAKLKSLKKTRLDETSSLFIRINEMTHIWCDT